MTRLYPYSRLFEDPVLKIEHITLRKYDRPDSMTLPEDDINEKKQIINLWPEGEKDWQTVVFDLSVDGSLANISDFDGDIQVVAVAECSATQVRSSINMQPSGKNTWSGQMSLERKGFSGPSSIKCFVSQKKTGNLPRKIGNTNSWTIFFDEVKQKNLRGALDIRWVHFLSSEKHVGLRDYSTEMYMLDFDNGNPVVLLNADFDGLYALFADSPRPSGARLAMVNAVRMSIAKNVLTSLLTTTLSEIVAKTNEDKGEPDWPTAMWKKNLLRAILPYVYPTLEEEAYLAQAVEEFKTGDLNNFVSIASAVVSRHFLKEGVEIKKSIRALQIV
jgi:hypothetical protein